VLSLARQRLWLPRDLWLNRQCRICGMTRQSNSVLAPWQIAPPLYTHIIGRVKREYNLGMDVARLQSVVHIVIDGSEHSSSGMCPWKNLMWGVNFRTWNIHFGVQWSNFKKKYPHIPCLHQ
jgi:hypothetical protein